MQKNTSILVDSVSPMGDNKIMEAKNKIIRIYTDKKGKSPFNHWLKSLKQPIVKARIRARLDRLQLGNYGDFKSVGEGVYELRLTHGPGYRIYYADYDDVIIILLCGGDKCSQDMDIKKAKAYWKELKERSNE